MGSSTGEALYSPVPVTDIVCRLGEAPLWHHLIQRLFWFDILGRVLHSCTARGESVRTYQLPVQGSAAMIAGPDRLLIATERGAEFLDLRSGELEILAQIEADNPRTRSNDGRGAPDGTFYTSTMGHRSEEGLGSIYQVVADGSVRHVLGNLNIPNSMAFCRDGSVMYYTDSPSSLLRRVDGFDGALSGGETVIHDLREQGRVSDGAVTDAKDHLWVGHWDGGEIVRMDADGNVGTRVPLPTGRPTRAAFGGSDLRTLFIATAVGDLADEPLTDPAAGRLLGMRVETPGRVEPIFGIDGRNKRTEKRISPGE